MRYIIIFFCLFLSLANFAQSASEAEQLFNSKQYTKAKTIYLSLLKRNPSDVLHNYRIARCYYELKDYENSIKHFELAGTKYPLRDLYLGELYYTNYQFEQSANAYLNYINSLDTTDIKIPELHKKIEKSNIASKLFNSIEDIAIVDSMIVNKNDFLRYFSINSEIGSLKQERIKLNNKITNDKISYTTQRADRICFSDSTHGNMDIFTSFKLLNEWSKPNPISKVINTFANENYPFLMLDGITLYFASDSENSIGGYDIFVTKYSSTAADYLTPENVGMPFNSIANDYMLVIDEIQHLGWFATDRNQQQGKVAIYKFIPNDVKKLFKSEDETISRKVAQLKQYRKAVVKTKKSTSSQSEMISNNGNIQLVISDSLVYNSFDKFQSTIALNIYKEWFVLSNEMKQLTAQLYDLRKQYSESLVSEQIKMKEKILALESRKIELNNQMSKKIKQVINEELKFIEKR